MAPAYRGHRSPSVQSSYSQDRSFVVLGENRDFVLVMAVGSIFGSFIGGRLLGMVPSSVLLSLLAPGQFNALYP